VLAAAEDALLRSSYTALIVVILAGMEITGLGWCGTRTGRGSELAHFYAHVLGNVYELATS
jgi:hypothetical protein